MVQRENHLQDKTGEEKFKNGKITHFTNMDKKDKMAATNEGENENQYNHTMVNNTNDRGLQQINNITATEEWPWPHREKELSFKKLQKIYTICEKDAFLHTLSLHYKETSHVKTGSFITEDRYTYSSGHDLLSGKQDRAVQLQFQSVLATQFGLLLGDSSGPRTEDILPGVRSKFSKHHYSLGAKTEDTYDLLLKGLLKRFIFNSDVRDTPQKEDAEEECRNPKKSKTLHPGFGQKNVGEKKEGIYQYVLSMKNTAFSESKYHDAESEKNFLLLIENNYFNVTRDNIPHDGHASQEALVCDYGHHDRESKGRHEQDLESEEICPQMIGSKQNKLSIASTDVSTRKSFDTQEQRVSNVPARDILDVCGEQTLVKRQKNVDDFGIEGIDTNIPKDCELKDKNSFDAFVKNPGKYSEEHVQERWQNVEMDPRLKLDAAHMWCRPETLLSTTGHQQDQSDQPSIVSSITEDSNTTERQFQEDEFEEDLPSAIENSIAEEACECMGSSSESTEFQEGEHQHFGEHLACAMGTKPTSETQDSDTCKEVNGVSVSKEESTDFIPRTEINSTTETAEKSKKVTCTEQPTSRLQDQERKVLTKEEDTGRYEYSQDDPCGASTQCNGTNDPLPSEHASVMSSTENCTERIPDRETLVSFRLPVQVSSAENSEVTCSPYTNPCNCLNEGPIPFSCDDESTPSSVQSSLPQPASPSELLYASASAAVPLPPGAVVHTADSLPPRAAGAPLIDLSLATDREYAHLRRRRATFGWDWSSADNPDSGINASDVSLSGFFVIGPGRRIRCFYCGLELDSLTSAHNIWDEHVRHNPRCVYLNLVMGSDLVRRTLQQLQKLRRL